MKLYFAKGTCSLAVRIVINELQLSCEFVEVDLQTHKTSQGEDYYTINPKGSVGTLQLDDGNLLTENAVIMQYLADTVADQTLLPASGLTRYQTLAWVNFVSTELHKGVAPLNYKISEESKEQIFRPAIHKRLQLLEAILTAQDYVMGEKASLADCYLYVVLRWLPHLGIARKSYPALENFLQRMQQREAVQISLQQEELNEDRP